MHGTTLKRITHYHSRGFGNSDIAVLLDMPKSEVAAVVKAIESNDDPLYSTAMRMLKGGPPVGWGLPASEWQRVVFANFKDVLGELA